MSITRDSINLILVTVVLFFIGATFGIPVDEFYFMDKIIETTDDIPKASGEWGDIQEETTNSAKFSYVLIKIAVSMMGFLSFVLAVLYLYSKYIM